MTPALEEAQKLLRLAQADQDAFAYLKPATHLTDAVVLFHAQQAIEKAMKAVLTAHEIFFWRTHDLLALAGLLETHGVRTPNTPNEIAVLNPYAVLFRYDDDDIALVTREVADEMVQHVLNWAVVQIEQARIARKV